MDFVKQQITSAVKNAGSGTTNNSSSNADPKSTATTTTAQGGLSQEQGQQQDLAKTISQTLANLQQASGGGSLLPAELSSEQLSQLGAGVAAERAKNQDKSAEAIGADTLQRVRDLQSQGQQGAEGAAALQGGIHQMAEKEALQGAVEQGRTFLTQQQQQQQGETEGTATTTTETANKQGARGKAATLGGDSTDLS
ncbi:hypothetical protein PG994_011516 [Apiospora phragmitis]|uniref:Uncharacterized protein n=1 Tax=Apiospora phragmitis TaxID=2905665 RepID=A0ABR1TT12_9PEZI